MTDLPAAPGLVRGEAAVWALRGQSVFYQNYSHVPGEQPFPSSDWMAMPLRAGAANVSVEVYPSQNGDRAALQSFADYTARVMASASDRLGFPGTDLHIEIRLVPSPYRQVRMVTFVRSPDAPYRLRFYLREEIAETHPAEFTQYVAHEFFHLWATYTNMIRAQETRFASRFERRMIDEFAAVVFSYCAQLDALGQASVALVPIGRYIDDSGQSRDIGPFSDHTLRTLLERNVLSERTDRYKAELAGVFMTMWSEFSGGSWVIEEDSPRAAEFQEVCETMIHLPHMFRGLLSEAANDGRDAPDMPPRPSRGFMPPER